MSWGALVTDVAGSIDLIRLEGEGGSVILRIMGKQDVRVPASASVLVGEFLVETPFVRGSLKTWIFPDDLWQWRDALDGLDAGHDIAWCEESRGPSMFIERDADRERAYVTLKDDGASLTTVTVTVPLADPWFDDAYKRLDLTWKTWPLTDE